MKLYWGCAHTQFHPARHLQFEHGFPYGCFDWRDFVEQSFRFARGHIDFYPIIYYPAYTYRIEDGLVNESVGMKDGFVREWDVVKELTRAYNEPGKLVTFPGYEWTGNRRRWGDHNVVYYDETGPLDLTTDVGELFTNLRNRRAMAIPHHTGYQVGYRGKDWERHDPLLSPVAEIYSAHGSSEGVGTAHDMRSNQSMSPRVSGGTIQDGLARGYRFGFIASGDNASGFPARWGTGLAAVWAEDLTREAIWEAFRSRRAYAVTGDRIRLELSVDDKPMGAVVGDRGDVAFHGRVVASDAVDRVELIRNGRVLETYCHRGRWRSDARPEMEVKLRFEFGWGPPGNCGLAAGDRLWKGSLHLRQAEILDVEGCFSRGPVSLDWDRDSCRWELVTSANDGPALGTSQQALVFTIEGRPSGRFILDTGYARHTSTLAQALAGAVVLPDLGTARRMMHEQFGLKELENAEQRAYTSACKTLISPAVPREAYDIPLSFTDRPPTGESYYYVRVTQDNGQMAWSSPIWVRNDP